MQNIAFSILVLISWLSSSDVAGRSPCDLTYYPLPSQTEQPPATGETSARFLVSVPTCGGGAIPFRTASCSGEPFGWPGDDFTNQLGARGLWNTNFSVPPSTYAPSGSVKSDSSNLDLLLNNRQLISGQSLTVGINGRDFTMLCESGAFDLGFRYDPNILEVTEVRSPLFDLSGAVNIDNVNGQLAIVWIDGINDIGEGCKKGHAPEGPLLEIEFMVHGTGWLSDVLQLDNLGRLSNSFVFLEEGDDGTFTIGQTEFTVSWLPPANPPVPSVVVLNGNPFGQAIEVQITSDQPQNAVLNLVDATGRYVHVSGNIPLSIGPNRYTITDLGRLPGGVYYLTVTGEDSGTFSVLKLIKR